MSDEIDEAAELPNVDQILKLLQKGTGKRLKLSESALRKVAVAGEQPAAEGLAIQCPTVDICILCDSEDICFSCDMADWCITHDTH